MPQFDFYVFLDIYINGFLFFIFIYILMILVIFLPFFYKGFYLKLFFNLNLNCIDQYFDYNKSLINLLTKKTLLFYFFFIFLFIITLLWWIPTDLICEDVEVVYFDPNPKVAAFLAKFYSTAIPDEVNFYKLIFAEVIGVAYTQGSHFKASNVNLPYDIKRVVGSDSYEMAREFAIKILEDNPDPASPINKFLMIFIVEPVDTVLIFESFDAFNDAFTAKYGKVLYKNVPFSYEMTYFTYFWTIEDLNPYGSRDVAKRCENYAKQSKYGRYGVNQNGKYRVELTEDGKRILESALKLFIKLNPSEDYTYFLKLSTVNYRFTPKEFLYFLYKFSWLCNQHIDFFFDNTYSLELDSFTSINIFHVQQVDWDIIQSISNQLEKEKTIVRHMLNFYYYPGVAKSAVHTVRCLDLVQDSLAYNDEKGAYKNTGGYPYVEIVFGDHRLCRSVYRYLRWVGSSGYIKDEESFLLYKKHSQIVLDLITMGKDFAKVHKLSVGEINNSIDFVLNMIERVRSTEEFYAKQFKDISLMRQKKSL